MLWGCTKLRMRVKQHYERKGRIFLEMQTCIKVEGTVGVVSMETKRDGEWSILSSPAFT